MTATLPDRDRYARQLILPDWGEAAQGALEASTVLVVGAGGLGSPVCLYLAAAGVGELRVCDSDRIELSNLNRQILYGEGDLGRDKVTAAVDHLQGRNRRVRLVAHALRLDARTVDRVAQGVDLVIDCVDDFAPRYVLNEYCVEHGIPFLHGGVWGMGGQVALLEPPATACLRCLFPEAPPREGPSPVLGAGAGLVGCTQALLALRRLGGLEVPERGHLLILDGHPLSLRQVALRRMADCPTCGHRVAGSSAQVRE